MPINCWKVENFLVRILISVKMDLTFSYLLMIAYFSIARAYPACKNSIQLAVEREDLEDPTKADLVFSQSLITVENLSSSSSESLYTFCSGVIINKNAILTTADCLQSYSNSTLTWASLEAGQVLLALNGSKVQTVDMKKNLTHESHTRKHLHSDGSNLFYSQNNIAIISVGPDIKFNDYLNVATFLEPTTNITEKTGFVIGWSPDVDTFEIYSIRVLSNEECQKLYPDIDFTEETMCGKSEDTKNHKNPIAYSGEVVSIGKKAAALLSCPSYNNKPIKNCDLTKPVILTNIGKHLAWIEETLKNNIC